MVACCALYWKTALADYDYIVTDLEEIVMVFIISTFLRTGEWET
jgi:hypothetical protein